MRTHNSKMKFESVSRRGKLSYVCVIDNSTEIANIVSFVDSGGNLLAQDISCLDAISQDLYREKFKKSRIFPSGVFRIFF